VVSERPHKTEVKWVRLAVGGNLVHYPGKVSTPAAEISTAKMLFNSTISTKNGRFAVFYLKNFYLGTPMQTWEYMHILISTIPDSIIAQYKLLDMVHNRYVLVEIMKGMYGLHQAAIVAYEQLVAHLAKHGYTQCQQTSGILKHTTRDITFCFVVGNFGVKYNDKTEAKHLINALREIYEIMGD
jgi:hypothetical protein